MFQRQPRLRERLPPLTARQEQVLELIAKGYTNFEIARSLDISLEGAKYHVREIMARLDVASREEAAAVWRSQRARRRMLGPVPITWFAAATGAVALAGGIVVSAIILAGRGDDSTGADPEPTLPATVAPTATPTEQPPSPTAPAFGPYPLGTRTGDPVLDAAIRAVEAGDADALFDLIHYAPVPCDNPNTGPPQLPGTFVCPNGEPDGTQIPALVAEGTDGWTLAESDPLVPELIADFMPADPRVFAVADIGSEGGRRTRLVFATGQALELDDTGIVTVLQVPTAPEHRVSAVTSYLLPPLPEDPDAFAENLRDELFAAAAAADLVNDAEAGYGMYSAWLDAMPNLTIVPPGESGDGIAVSAVAMPIVPPPDVPTAHAQAVFFAIADRAGNCAGGFIGVTFVDDAPQGGFKGAGPVVLETGADCTANAVVAAYTVRRDERSSSR